LLDTHIEIHDRPGAVPMDGVRQGIEFQEVHFEYAEDGGDSCVLEGINLSVRPRMVTAFVGSSGAGKSTLVSLLPRFHDVSRGRIMVDGVDIRELTLKSLRQQVSIVLQEPLLFSGTSPRTSRSPSSRTS
jgi:ABC-type multidrug transport system fused ATPase/permease subunit